MEEKKEKMYEAEAVAKMEVKSQREEAELDMKTIEEKPRRPSTTRTSRESESSCNFTCTTA